jgi:site-specific recombinase XerD
MKTEKPLYQISITLDKRRAKISGKYPVKLQVYYHAEERQKRYATKFECTVKEFASVWLTKKPRGDAKLMRKEMTALQVHAEEVAGELKPFTFEEFERRLYQKPGDKTGVMYHFIEMIAKMREDGRIGSAVSYESSMKSISGFTEQKKPFEKLTFFEVNEAWLNKYQKYMTEDLGKSMTTVGIYLRQFRVVYRKAIAAKEVPSQIYPFGDENGKYTIPGSNSVKKALSAEQMSILIHSKALTPEQEKARDFWLFSYACSGMNIKDIALLKKKDIQDDMFSFIREKTKRTTKGNPVRIKVSLNSYSKSTVEKYGTGSGPNDYVFGIISKGMTPQEIQQKVGNFTRFINQNLKKLCKANDLPEKISVNWARHTHATLAVRRGSTMEFVGATLGHKNFSTTQRYFEGFEDEEIEEFAQNNMDFDKT